MGKAEAAAAAAGAADCAGREGRVAVYDSPADQNLHPPHAHLTHPPHPPCCCCLLRAGMEGEEPWAAEGGEEGGEEGDEVYVGQRRTKRRKGGKEKEVR